MFDLEPVEYPTASMTAEELADDLDVDFGHAWPTTPIPIGGRVEIDPRTETVRFE